jgi:hypothetical protein
MHGQKYTMADVQKMVAEDPDMHNLTCEQKKEFIKQLMDHHELQTSGVQASNVAAARDAVAVMDGVSKEVSICQSSNFTVDLRFYSFMRYVTERHLCHCPHGSRTRQQSNPVNMDCN